MRTRIKASGIVALFITAFLIGLVFVLIPPARDKKDTAGNTAQAEPTGKDSRTASSKPVIAVSILPHSYFVKRIGGDSVSVLTLVGAGQSPHTYEPTPRQMEELSKAQVWILSGTDFEDRIKPKVASLYPNLKLIDGTAGVKFRTLEAHEHDHEDQIAKSTETPRTLGLERDRHTWLGKEPAEILAGHVRDALSWLVPEKGGEFRKNYDALVREIESEFEGLKRDLSSLRGRSVYVYHPAFGYFLDEFGIAQQAVETGGKEPNPQTLATLIQKARADKVKVIFLQAQFPTQAAKTLAKELNAEVVALDPLSENWLENIRKMGEALKKAAQ